MSKYGIFYHFFFLCLCGLALALKSGCSNHAGAENEVAALPYYLVPPNFVDSFVFPCAFVVKK